MQADDGFHQHRFARAGLADNHVAMTVVHLRRDVVQDYMPVKTLMYVLHCYHDNISLVRKISRKRIITLELTTALVEALPTSSAPPRVV